MKVNIPVIITCILLVCIPAFLYWKSKQDKSKSNYLNQNSYIYPAGSTLPNTPGIYSMYLNFIPGTKLAVIPSLVENTLADNVVLLSISGLQKNTITNVMFNDLMLKFLTDENGTLYFNKNKEPFPLYLTYFNNPYVETFIDSVPVGNFIVLPRSELVNKNSKFTMNLDLSYIEPRTKRPVTVRQTALISGGAISIEN